MIKKPFKIIFNNKTSNKFSQTKRIV